MLSAGDGFNARLRCETFCLKGPGQKASDLPSTPGASPELTALVPGAPWGGEGSGVRAPHSRGGLRAVSSQHAMVTRAVCRRNFPEPLGHQPWRSSSGDDKGWRDVITPGELRALTFIRPSTLAVAASSVG